MSKFLLVIVLGCAGGFIYSPYAATDKYAAAVVARDGKTLAELTDIPSVRESMKESFRPVVAEYLRQNVPNGLTAQQANNGILAGVVMAEKQLDLMFTAENMQEVIDSVPHDIATSYEFTHRGWRNPFTFVAIDTEDSTKNIFEFQGLTGWKLIRSEASKETVRKNVLRGLRQGR